MLTVTALIVSYIRKFNFFGFQLLIMVSIVAFTFDMTIDKRLWSLYHYVDINSTAFYSLLACLLIYPLLGFIFYKFLPSQKGNIAVSIAAWSLALTAFEIYIIKPYNIVIYTGWAILPWSLLVYIVSFSWEYAYYNVLLKRHQSK